MSRFVRPIAAGLAVFLFSGLSAVMPAPAGATDDTQPPVLTSLSLSPSSVDTSASFRTIKVTARITDDISGVFSSYTYPSYGPGVTFLSPSGIFWVSTTLTRVSGTIVDGTWEGTVTVPRYSEQGVWTISEVAFSDNAYHSRRLTASDLEAAGLPTGFEQTGVGDTTPPTLASLSLSPRFVDTSASARQIIVQAGFTDEKSGVNTSVNPWVKFTSPSGLSDYWSLLRVSGTPQDGLYQVTITVPQGAEQGIWKLTGLAVSDQYFNSTYLTEADLAATGFPVTFEQTNGLPAAPTGVVASGNDGSATVVWKAPAANGTAPVSSYRVTAYSGGTPVSMTTVEVPATSANVTGLVNGSAYTFTVAATNAAGTSAESAASNTITPVTVPGVPSSVVATAGNASAEVSWSAPGSDGGTPVISYRVTAYDGGVAVESVDVPAGPATSTTVSGLANNTNYTFRVAATNSVGTGAESAASNTIVPRPGQAANRGGRK